jgi:FtsP/CotA-like multicopper oxidase with cupredoxin domain
VEGYWTERPVVLPLNRDLELVLHVRSVATLPWLLLLTPWAHSAPRSDRGPRALAIGPSKRVRISDNRRPAGTLRDGVLTVHLEARLGMWYPDGDHAPGAEVPAFAAEGGPPEIPGPLIRVPAGTEIAITVRNALPNAALTLHGLHARPRTAAAADTVHVAPRTTGAVRFRLDAPGTYYYWGTTMGRVFLGRTREDAQLSGAIVVDAPERPVREDRILMIGMWADTLNSEDAPVQRQLLFVVNGRSWPHTERLSYAVGDTVRWRVLNVSADLHPMHLHGFFFRVDSRGDGTGDTTYTAATRDLVVTQRMIPGQTMLVTWVPDRPGNWLFHCHVPTHFGPRGPLGSRRAELAEGAPMHAWSNHALQGMNGLVVGITVTANPGQARAPATDAAGRRRLRLLVRANAGGTAAAPYYGFTLHEDGPEPPPDSGGHAGSPIVLTRGEPVSIMVVNRTPEPTAVHWHGIELESYFDGVAGFSGSAGRLAPVIAPGDSFEARFTPPRAGTFIYHTHVDELRQEPAGLAGPLIVLAPGTRYDPATDLTVLISTPSDSAHEARAVLLNGSLAAAPLELRSGVAHRLRMINITTSRPGMRMELRSDSVLGAWRVIAKDGAELATGRQVTTPARQPISIGETVDVEVTPPRTGEMRLEARTARGVLLGVVPVRVRD